jgi:hypothetical protein
MSISPDNLGVSDVQLARRVIVHARMTIAPCLDSLTDEPREDAIAILAGVAKEAMARGARDVTSQRVGTASVSYGSASSWFTDDDKAALRALCAPASTADGSHPIGRFPLPARAYRHVWPEEEER